MGYDLRTKRNDISIQKKEVKTYNLPIKHTLFPTACDPFKDNPDCIYANIQRKK